MAEQLRGPVRRFVEDYRRVRRDEGYASDDPAFAARLPFIDTTGRNRAAWRVRARHYLVVRALFALLPRFERVLDLGAGNGWLARRLARSRRVTALDVDAGPTGLGALGDRRVDRVCAELESLPFAAGRFDAAIAAASLHYAVDLPRALGELGRVLRPGGVLVVVDSPVYADAAARDRARQRTRAYFEAAGAAHLADRYRGLVRRELDDGGAFRFTALTPGIGSFGAALSRLRGRAEGARMPVLLGRRR
jgi:SAM-dependent methyltransferase